MAQAAAADVSAAYGIANARLEEPVTVSGLTRDVLDASLGGAVGEQQIIVRLRTPTIANVGGAGKAQIATEQAAFVQRVLAVAPTARVIASTQIVLNAVFLEVSAADLPTIASDPSVTRVAPVGNYQIDLAETVPYIGAETVQGSGFNGAGIRVAVLDSGVDYLHADLGGSGNPADFAANDPAIIEPGTFPTAKVIGGMDFTGQVWPNGPLATDPDPLDKDINPADGDGSGHGTHVGDIIAGRRGVAPGASLYAVKVCSSVSSSCSGVALIQGMEFAVDPNGDGDTHDRVDIVNMSLGAGYGQPFDDDLSTAVDNASALNVLTVASAGNAADKPYIVGSPSAANTALSVAQTAVPSAFIQLMTIVAPPVANPNRLAVFQTWSAPLTSVIEGVVLYDTTNVNTRRGCTDAGGTSPWTGTPLAGRIVLVDRGLCAASMKISNIRAAGGIVGIIGFVDGSAPFAFSFGGGDPSIPGYAISLTDANAIRGGATVRFDPNNILSLAGSMASTSSRGPQLENHTIKPEIGAPGASVSAEHGTGTGRTAFGGTSGAAPMVSGSAALLLQARPDLRAGDLKQLLINTADPDVLNTVPGGLAPISRIGGGEVRVDRAVGAPSEFFSWDGESRHGGISFGLVDVWQKSVTLRQRLGVWNQSHESITYNIATSMRFADDAANGAVSLSAPASITVGPGQTRTFTLRMTINGELLRSNSMNSGTQGANPAPLTLHEYDGYVTLTASDHTLSLPWHVLPRRDARVVADWETLHFVDGASTVPLRNFGVGTAQPAVYSLLGLSDNIPEGERGQQSPTPDLRAVGVTTIPVPTTTCTSGFIWSFLVNNWERQSHLVPVSNAVYLDTNRDGIDDFRVLNRDLSLNNITDGRQVTFAIRLSNGQAQAFFFAVHPMNSANTQLLICGEQVGLTAADVGTRLVNARFAAEDFYFGGPGDVIGGLTITPGGERFVGTASDIPGNSTGSVTVTDRGALPGNTPELGVLVQTDAPRSAASQGAATHDTEAVILRAHD
jgi:subtilisin family serine protease